MSQIPAAGTPNFTGPTSGGFGTTVAAIAQVGNYMVAGGNFTQVNGASRPYLAAWGAPTGPVSGVLPASTTNGEVLALQTSADRHGFYAAGRFTSAGGIRTSVALYSLVRHSIISSFRVVVDGSVSSLQLVGNRLLIGGAFSHVNGVVRFGLASVNATTGALDNYLTVHVAGHHNFNPTNHGGVAGAVGVASMAVSPDGARMMVIGNFTQVYDQNNPSTGYARDQIMNITLGDSAATVDPGWNSLAYHGRCDYPAFDSYMTQVAWAPNGSYFVVTTTGGFVGGTFQPCDAASRFEAGASGANVLPTWIDDTGSDSLYSVAVTSAAVYVGGHQRWLNNPYGNNVSDNGGVPRAGIAALDPANGEPLAWNPGRNPRGHGTIAILATKTGVFFGSDTDCIGPGNGASCSGPGRYPRSELAYFPYAGGSLPVGNSTGTATKILVAGSTVTAHNFNPANGAGGPVPGASNSINWSSARGAFYLNGRVYYGDANGKFYYRTFSLAGGGTYGPPRLIDPYDDPTWDTIQTGSGNTYQGVPSSFYTDIPRITSMFYYGRAIFYTMVGDPRLYRRWFTPGTEASPRAGQDTGGVVSPVRIPVVNPGGLMNFVNAGGMFVAGGKLFVASSGSGALYEMGFNGTTVTTRPVQDGFAGGGWAGRAVFVAQ